MKTISWMTYQTRIPNPVKHKYFCENKPLTNFAESSILDVSKSFEYASAYNYTYVTNYSRMDQTKNF